VRDYNTLPAVIVNSDIPRAVDLVTDAVLQALAGETPTAPAVRLLLRRYAATGRADIRDVLEPALTRTLDLWPRAGNEQWGWLMLFAEAAGVSDDDRLQEAIAGVTADLQASWGLHRPIATAVAGIDACLRAANIAEYAGNLQAAIDELERVVASAYQPGEGLAGAARDGHARLADHVRTASALLTAFECTGRLPYSMLAEELMQFAGRMLREASSPGFFDGETGVKPFTMNCEAASVLFRLAALHESDDYRGAAVVAAGADYGRDAANILYELAIEAPRHGLESAAFGLAASEWHSPL
jgi:hypothetical protein